MEPNKANFELADIDGNRRSLLTGACVVVFLREDCPTCHYTIPYLNELHDMSPLPVVGVSQDDAAGSRRLEARFPVLIDQNLAVSREYELEFVPTILLFDKHRRIVFKDVGFSRRGLNELAARVGVRPLVPSDPSIPESRMGCGAKNLYPESALSSRRFMLEPEQAVEWYFERGFTDGLPIVPPTERLVMDMIEGTYHGAGTVLGNVPPNYAPATVEKVAVNAVMAGARPEYMPIIVAGVRAMCRDEFNIHGLSATTHSACPLFIVNGPVRSRVGLNSGIGVFGPGFRANATIGRTFSLILRNLGGARPGEITRTTLGHPGRLSYCIAENEEQNPWEPFQVNRGFGGGQSTITAFPGDAPISISDHGSRRAKALASMLGLSMAGIWNHKAYLHWPILLILGPEHVRTFREEGWSKQDIQQHIFERVRRPIGELRSDDDGGEVFRAVSAGIDPHRDPAELVPKFKSPDNIWIIVAGGTAGKFSAVVPSWSIGPAGSVPVTEIIE